MNRSPVSIFRMQRPVLISHIRIEPSSAADRRYRPLGWNTSPCTQPSCPTYDRKSRRCEARYMYKDTRLIRTSVCRHWPVRASHILIFWSREAVTTNATERSSAAVLGVIPVCREGSMTCPCFYGPRRRTNRMHLDADELSDSRHCIARGENGILHNIIVPSTLGLCGSRCGFDHASRLCSCSI